MYIVYVLILVMTQYYLHNFDRTLFLILLLIIKGSFLLLHILFESTCSKAIPEYAVLQYVQEVVTHFK